MIKRRETEFNKDKLYEEGVLVDYKKSLELYEGVKQRILYTVSSLHTKVYLLPGKDIDDEVREKYFEEEAGVSFENRNGDTVTMRVSRWHDRLRWSRYGFYDYPSFDASIKVNGELVWGLHRDNIRGQAASSLELPTDILMPSIEKQDSIAKVFKKIPNENNK